MQTIKTDHHKKKTYTKYWNNFNEKKKKKFVNLFRVFKNFIEKKTGYKIQINIKRKKYTDYSFNSFQKNGKIKKSQISKLSEIIINYLKSININVDSNIIHKLIEEFNECYYNSPVKELGSGTGYNQALIIFIIVKLIRPKKIIESGVMKGFTTYIFNQASSNDCKIFCYDINFNNLEYKSENAEYFENDISLSKIKFDHNTLAFWDDHCSQFDRFNFSKEHNIKNNIFDDDLSFFNFHSDGWPPLPTMNMLLDSDIKNFDDLIEWSCNNKSGEIYIKNFKNLNIQKEVLSYKIFPELFEITGYRNRGQTSFLQLK